MSRPSHEALATDPAVCLRVTVPGDLTPAEQDHWVGRISREMEERGFRVQARHVLPGSTILEVLAADPVLLSIVGSAAGGVIAAAAIGFSKLVVRPLVKRFGGKDSRNTEDAVERVNESKTGQGDQTPTGGTQCTEELMPPAQTSPIARLPATATNEVRHALVERIGHAPWDLLGGFEEGQMECVVTSSNRDELEKLAPPVHGARPKSFEHGIRIKITPKELEITEVTRYRYDWEEAPGLDDS